MRFVLFYHSLISDWNHGNAHFLRGVMRELLRLGHQVDVYEPRDNWSLANLRQQSGDEPIREFLLVYPELKSEFYDPRSANLDLKLAEADVVIVHEWNDPETVAAIGRHHARNPRYHLLFHDTHHRSVTAVEQMRGYELDHYDGVLAFGEVIRKVYLERGWIGRAWTWHEAADTSLFHPMHRDKDPSADLVWIGNWGDEERSDEIRQFLIEPAKQLKLSASVYGVRYPPAALQQLADADIYYGGWLPNYRVPRVFAEHRCTVHIPRRPYREQLIGVPTIRVFEALACGIPLISMRWDDAEGLFRPGIDYILVDTPAQMKDAIQTVLADRDFADTLAAKGRESILQRHTCEHRVKQLLDILSELSERPDKTIADIRLRRESVIQRVKRKGAIQ